MGLLEQAREDVKDYSGSTDDFAVSITLTAPNGETKTLKGIHSKHHMSVDTDGALMNSKNAHIAFSEDLAGDYPLRNNAGEVSMKGHKITVKDSTGDDKVYVVREWYPDETVGLIVCILGNYG